MIEKMLHIVLFAFLAFHLQAQTESALEAHFSVQGFIDKGDYGSAQVAASEYLKNYPNDAYMQLHYARLCLDEGMIDRAKAAFTISKAEFTAESLFGLAACAAADYDVNLTVEYLEAYFLSPGHKQRSEVITDPQFDAVTSRKEWKDFWENMQLSVIDAKIDEVVYLINSENYYDALHLCNNMLAKRTDYRWFYYRALCSFYLDDFRPAKKDIQKARKMQENRIEYLVLEGEILMAIGNSDQAVEIWNVCVEHNNNNPRYYLQRGVAAYQAKDYKTAYTDLALYTRYFSHNDSVQYVFARAAMNYQRYWDAIQAFNILIDKDPSKKAYFNQRGNCFYTLEEWRPAIESYQMSLDIDPKQGEIWFKAGVCAHQMSDSKKACFYWNRALTLDYPDAFTALQQYCR